MTGKLHYFNDGKADPTDFKLVMAKRQGYVPVGCLLAGIVVMSIMNEGGDPCKGCSCDRSKCRGRPE